MWNDGFHQLMSKAGSPLITGSWTGLNFQLNSVWALVLKDVRVCVSKCVCVCPGTCRGGHTPHNYGGFRPPGGLEPLAQRQKCSRERTPKVNIASKKNSFKEEVKC